MSHVLDTKKDRNKDGGWKVGMVTGLKTVLCVICFKVEERTE